MRRLIPGTSVSWKGDQCVVLDLEGLTHAVLRSIESQRTVIAPVSELTPLASQSPPVNIHDVTDEAWRDALKLFETLSPLIYTPRHKRTAADIDRVAEQLGKSRHAVYKYLQAWQRHGRLSALVRKERKDKGQHRLASNVEAIVNKVINDFFAQDERPDIVEATVRIQLGCREAGVPAPSVSTVRRIISKLPPRALMKARYGAKAAREKFEPLRGSFPGADFPLAVVQIDHTPVDVIFVDETERREIGRCYLTLVLDVCTRLVCGFCVTLEAPSSLSAALALSHAILPKDAWLHERQIPEAWPIYGIPRKIHVDNAKEFRGTALSRGCAEHNIILENRPKGLPNYGGHIERSFRTFMKASQRVKGTTFSNVVVKAKYNSEGKAIMTIREFERWFAIYVIYRYHHKKHSATGYPPINLYKKYILGDDQRLGIGQPPPIRNPRRLMLDFFPFFSPTVQNYGIVFERIHYWEDTLRQWVHANDPTDPRKKRKFTVAYDPRNLSVLYFHDPISKEYIDIPCRDKGRPPFSIWELRKAKEWLSEDPLRRSNEDMIFQGIELLRDIEEESEKTTKQVRRLKERRKHWNEKSLGESPKDTLHLITDGSHPHGQIAHAPTVPIDRGDNDDDDDAIKPFDIEMQ
jgi:putative transposase